MSLSLVSETPVRPEPLKMSWITDFTIVCPDRDILVVKECLKLSSKLFRSILEDDNDCDSLPCKWNSLGIAEAMRYIHTFPTRFAKIELFMDSSVLDEERDMVEFCFQYEIEPLLTTLKDEMMELISDATISPKWLGIFHGFKNKNKTEPFKPQIDAIVHEIVNNEKGMEIWLELKYNSEDMIMDYKAIIRGLGKRLQNDGKKLQSPSSLPLFG